jgi:hypothetical protein
VKSVRREVAELRGRIVRAIQQHAGTARTDDYLRAMAEAGQFNRDYPDRAIPRPFHLLGFHPPVCPRCSGEGSVAVPAMGVTKVESDCGSCYGSGFRYVRGMGAEAVVGPDNPLR